MKEVKVVGERMGARRGREVEDTENKLGLKLCSRDGRKRGSEAFNRPRSGSVQGAPLDNKSRGTGKRRCEAEMKRRDEHKVRDIKESGIEEEFVGMCMHNACARVTPG